jgi:peptide-methionine (R)-S-oxide reductase
MKKRYFLQIGAATIGAIALSRWTSARTSIHVQQKGRFEITKTDAEWREILTPQQFSVLRREGTEPRFSSPLDKQFAPGIYPCAGCDLPLFSSETKYDSGTGWPSFYAPLTNAIRLSDDHAPLLIRNEVHCRRCGGHLGHVFGDGPAPTGKRYCINGLALTFIAA